MINLEEQLEDISKSIVDLAAGGDIEAFEKIYKASSAFVYTIALRIANDQDDAEDIMQEVFIKVYRNLAQFRFSMEISYVSMHKYLFLIVYLSQIQESNTK